MEEILQRIAKLETLIDTCKSEAIFDRNVLHERLDGMTPLIDKANENRERIRSLEVQMLDHKALLENVRTDRIDLLRKIEAKTETMEERLRAMEIKGGIALGAVTALQSVLSIVLHIYK